MLNATTPPPRCGATRPGYLNNEEYAIVHAARQSTIQN